MRKGMGKALALLTAMCLVGCGSEVTTTEVNTSAGDVEQTEATEVVSEETEETKEIVKRDTVACPTNYVTDDQMKLADAWAGSSEAALAEVMKKAERKEKVTVAVIGGSITQGTISNGTKDSEVETKERYADIFRDWWTATFPETEIEYVNAGIGATDSYLGVHRVQEDVLSHNPDLVLIEFSVNDGNTTTAKINYDNLIRTIAKSEQSPAILLLFMAQTSLDSAQQMHSAVGFNYQLPMVSYKNVIADMMENNIYTKEELSKDTVHPSALGHRIVGEIIWKYLNSVYEVVDSYEEPVAFDFKPATKELYTNNAHILDSKSITPDSLGTFVEKEKVFDRFPNDWQCVEGDGEITFTTTCRNLGIMYYCQVDGKGGQFEVYVDGEKQMTLNANFKNGWGNYAESKEVYTSDVAAEHVIVIKKAPDSTGDEFNILGLLVSE